MAYQRPQGFCIMKKILGPDFQAPSHLRINGWSLTSGRVKPLLVDYKCSRYRSLGENFVNNKLKHRKTLQKAHLNSLLSFVNFEDLMRHLNKERILQVERDLRASLN